MAKEENHILKDEKKFKDIMMKAGYILNENMKDKYYFMTEEALKLYDKFSEEVIPFFHQETRENPGFKLSVLQMMGLVASQQDRLSPEGRNIEGNNVVDFVEYKKSKETLPYFSTQNTQVS